MANYIGTDTDLTALANAIRAKNEIQDSLVWPKDFIKYVKKIGVVLPESVSFSSGTPEDITTIVQAAREGIVDLQEDYGWAVGDIRTITINEFTVSNITFSEQDIDIVISSFDDYSNCGCSLQFDFKDCLAEKANMHPSFLNRYATCDMKTTILPALVEALPSWLKNLLITFSCPTSNGSSTIEMVTGNKLALRSQIEIANSTNNMLNWGLTYAGEGIFVPYYSPGGHNIFSASRRKKLGHNGSYTYWWLRSPQTGVSYKFCFVSEDGTNTSASGSNQGPYGIAPFGCL